MTHQLATWLLAANGSEMPPRREGLAAGRWIVAGDGEFAEEVFSDLTRAGLEVVVVDPQVGPPDVTQAVGLVAGTSADTVNLSMASRARLSNPDLYVAVRQRTHTNAPLLEALDFDSVFSPTDLVAQEVLARLTTPYLWRFMTHVAEQDDDWSAALLGRLEATCGPRSPPDQPVDRGPGQRSGRRTVAPRRPAAHPGADGVRVQRTQHPHGGGGPDAGPRW
ncbi:MAG: hypothetical protein IPI32_07960 [Austwickia sp.]|nr:hypothetical protein [Austwickia sp.]